MREVYAERIEYALNQYGNDRDWGKMRADEMAEIALGIALDGVIPCDDENVPLRPADRLGE